MYVNTFMVKTLTIADDVYEELRRIKEKIGGSFSDVVRYLLRKEFKSKRFVELARKLKIKVDVKKIREAWKEWEERLS